MEKIKTDIISFLNKEIENLINKSMVIIEFWKKMVLAFF